MRRHQHNSAQSKYIIPSSPCAYIAKIVPALDPRMFCYPDWMLGGCGRVVAMQAFWGIFRIVLETGGL